MRKDWLVWGCVIALFGAGAIWSRLFGLYPVGGSLVDLIGLLTALGTLGAALAAWKAAAKSGEQLEQMQQQGRWQQYDLHYRQFVDLLSGIEKTTELRFFHIWDFYEDLFPQNRNFKEPLSLRCIDHSVKAWHIRYKDLLRRCQVNEEPTPEHVVEWIKDLFSLGNNLRLEMLPYSEKQLRLAGRELSFGVGPGNTKVALFKVGLALDTISRFCDEQDRVTHQTLSANFEAALIRLFSYPKSVPTGFIVD